MNERHLLGAAEVALGLVTAAAVFGMQRLFNTSSFVPTLLLHTALAHSLVTVLRRRGIGLVAAGAITAACAAICVTVIGYGDTTAYGIPTHSTLTDMGKDIDAAWSLFQQVVAPAPLDPGFVLITAIAVWFVAFVADWAAFRLWVPFEATLPASTLFLFGSLLGADRYRSQSLFLFAGAAVGFMLIHRVIRQDGTSHWVTEHRSEGHRALLVVGGSLGALAILVAVIFGPELPGAGSAPLVKWRDLTDGPSSRITVSPLVDMKPRLVDQANVEVFTVRATERAYWRLTALDRFDGRIWSSSGSYGKARGGLPHTGDQAPRAHEIVQAYTIEALAAIWLPSAYQPRRIDVSGASIRFDEVSSTLIVDTELPSSDGISYQVSSELPELDPTSLRTATAANLPASVTNHFLALPADLNPNIVQLAREITAKATTPYDQARALQDYLRTFTYDLSVPPGHSDNALEHFLFETKRGYCEQFAGAYAAMARAIGLPARVAVGFTPGVADPSDAQVYHVRGEHAHAWPEVYLAGFGWVAFEPTPGRGAPGAEIYTGVKESQAATGNGGVATTIAPVQTTQVANPNSTSSTFKDPFGDALDTRGKAPKLKGEPVASRWYVRSVLIVAATALALGVLYLILVPLIGWVRRIRRRRRLGIDPSGRVQVAWAESVETLELVGVSVSSSETFGEYARRVDAALPDAGLAVNDLARRAEVAHYAPEGADEDVAVAAEGAAGSIAATVHDATTIVQRARRALDVRTILPRTSRTRRRAGMAPRRRW